MSAVRTQRRELRFESFDEVVDDVNSHATPDAQTLGNWSVGQICEHLAVAMERSIDGYGFQAPWPIRLGGRLLKRRILTKPMRAGFKLRGKAREVLVPEHADDAEARKRLLHAITRLREEATREPHPVFGRLTRDEYDLLHLRHAELHLSFIANAS